MESALKTIDCRNLDCPAPVIATKKALDEKADSPLQVLVDGGAALENVTRFAEKRGFSVTIGSVEDGYSLLISANNSAVTAADSVVTSNSGHLVMLITSDRLGQGPEDLGRLLMKNLIITLLDQDRAPDRIYFVNSGVLLTTEGSEVLDPLDRLGNRGVEVLSCGVCLDYFKKKDQLKVGMVTNMFTIVESLTSASSVITL